MTIELKLDTAALNALFPEGSAARVNLARAVTVNLVEKLAVKEVKHLDATLTESVRQQILQTMRDKGMTLGWKNKVVLGEEVLSEIADFTRLKIKDAIAAEAVAAFAKLRPSIKDAVNARFEGGTDFESNIALRDHVRSIVKETLRGL